MHLRKLVLGCGLALALLSNMAVALGLGEIRLNSTLNEPLNAEIKLLDTRGLNSDQIIVALASPADFERNGVERIYFFTEFQFEVLLNQPGGALVRITSRNPVREPFINFLVEARWPTGRLLREYTLLLDLPTFSETATAPVQRPASQPDSRVTTGTVPRSAPQQSAPTSVRETSRPAASSAEMSGDSYTVSANDTLWQIALDMRPDSSHSVHQTMLAIQRLNPDAFINNNVNLLRRGQVLRIPSSDDIMSVSRRDAVNSIARQNQDWADDGMGAQLSAARRDTGSRRDADQVSGSVKLATPSSVDAAGGQGSGDNTGSGRALESQLAATLEELDKTKSDNSELSSRVRDLEEQIETMERLVEVSNEQLRALQLGAAQADQATDVEPDLSSPDPSTPEVATGSDSPVEVPAPSDTDFSDPVAGQAQVEEPAVVPEESAPVVTTPAQVDSRNVVSPPRPKTVAEHFMDHLLWVIAGLVVLVGLVAFIIYRRQQTPGDEDFSSDEDVFDSESAYPEDEYQPDALDLGEPDSEDLTAFDEEVVPAEAETGDVVGEADIYIAYGKFDQAEEMLLNGLAKDPDSIDVRLKLLEVYSQTQDARKFDQYYAGLIGVAAPSVLSRAAELRSHIVDADVFDPLEHENLAPTNFDVSTEESVSLNTGRVYDSSDEFEAELESEAEAESPFAKSDDLAFEDELDFSLDLEDEDSSDDDELIPGSDLSTGDTRYDLSFSEEPLDAVEPDEDELSLDFDLDDDLAVNKVEPASTASDELTFSLEDRDDIGEVRPTNKALVNEDEFRFELEEEETNLDSEELVISDELEITDEQDDTAEELQISEDLADDFNLDMDVEDLDLAALDQEMDSLDADFDELETSSVFAESTDTVVIAEESDDDLVLVEPDVVITEEREIIVEAETEDDVAEEDVFDRALSEFSSDDSDDSSEDVAELEDLSEDDMDAELDFLADADEAATKLDLARAYIDMGDTDGARDILAEVSHEGNDQQRQEAAELLGRIDA